jgi:hypothetical protein
MGFFQKIFTGGDKKDETETPVQEVPSTATDTVDASATTPAPQRESDTQSQTTTAGDSVNVEENKDRNDGGDSSGDKPKNVCEFC